jgi:hypothetical protein
LHVLDSTRVKRGRVTADLISFGTVALHQGCGGTVGISNEGLRVCNRCEHEVSPGLTRIGRETCQVAPSAWDGTGPYEPLAAADASHLLSEYFTYLAVSAVQGPAAAALATGAGIGAHAERMDAIAQQLQTENRLLRELGGEKPALSPGPVVPYKPHCAAAVAAADVAHWAESTAASLHQLLIENGPLREQYTARLQPDLGLEL